MLPHVLDFESICNKEVLEKCVLSLPCALCKMFSENNKLEIQTLTNESTQFILWMYVYVASSATK